MAGKFNYTESTFQLDKKFILELGWGRDFFLPALKGLFHPIDDVTKRQD
jgi:hypothetical protein